MDGIEHIDDQSSDYAALAPEFNDRRRDSPMQLLHLVQRIDRNQVKMDEKLSKHMATETHELAEAITKLMADAFPLGDPGGHRRHHELVIKQAEERAKFWQEMRIAGAKWAGVGALGLLAGLIWTGAMTKLMALLAGAKP
jgi:hypothetical protein